MLMPSDIRVLKEKGLFEIDWDTGEKTALPFRYVRIQCPCAACINEFTGEQILDPASVPEDVSPEQVGFAGNYGLKIGWTDGHHSGIFTWERLKALWEHRAAK